MADIQYVIEQKSYNTVIQQPTQTFEFGNGVIPAVISQIIGLQAALDAKENSTNKSNSYTASSSTTYTSTKALVDGLSDLEAEAIALALVL